MRRSTILCLSIFLIGVIAHAYIVSSRFIFERVTQQHGKSSYSIEQEVTFREGAESLIVKEIWLVADGGEMRVIASANGFKTFRLLKKKRVFWIDGGSERSDEMSDAYFMSPLLLRSATEEKKFFIKWNILPEDILREKKPVKDLKLVKNETEPFVRLARTAGTVAYAFGEPAPVEGPLPAGLWIEQDEFTIRKMRTPDGSEFVGNDYAAFSKNLWYPKTQNISFGNHQVSIRVTNLNSVEFSSEQKKQFDPGWVRNRPELATVWPKTNISMQVQDFYKRFR